MHDLCVTFTLSSCFCAPIRPNLHDNAQSKRAALFDSGGPARFDATLLTLRTTQRAATQSLADGEVQRARKVFTVDETDGPGLA